MSSSMKQPPTITDAESRVMAKLWERSPQTAEELAGTLGTTQGWRPSTIKTLLNRLLQKGAVSAEKDGRRFLYSAVLELDAWQRSQSASLVDRLFGGHLAPLVAQFHQERLNTPQHRAAEHGRPTDEGDVYHARPLLLSCRGWWSTFALARNPTPPTAPVPVRWQTVR